MFKHNLALLVAALVPFAKAQNETAEAAVSFLFPDYCCTVLSLSPLRERLLFPGQSAFESRVHSYFDIKQQSLTPNCLVQPRDTKEVALTVKILTTASILKPCKFAIRSGGHTPYAGASNIEDGVTVDLQYLSAVQYDAKNNLVKVGPGARWNDVFTTLEPLGVITTGGRSSTVGVGGLTLGGGISYFSPEHGLICDNVLEFEVVLADGRIVTASKTQNPDLFTVLKGGNNNFGIVTNFKFGTFKYDGMWGGLVAYPESTIQDQFKALINFSNNIDKNLKAAAIVMPVYQSAVGSNLILNTYDYAEPVPRPAAYNEFFAIPGNVSDTTGLRNMSSLAVELKGATTHSVYFGTLTFANDLRVMTEAHNIFKDVLANLKAKATGDWGIYVLYQPLPPAYTRNSAAKGGNVLGFERFKDQVLCLYQPYISWQGAQQDALFQGAGADLINRIRAYAESIGADNPYLYLDYADKTQDPLKSYGPENVQKMKAAAKKYDPHGVFQNLVPGGFKISKVQ
ncbi:FAD-binding domain-containing protein [Cucurbitaria berberidis CBS 394.84]|uniref:FAD-binding domain-containing protein n=1 Tax=Cucurbitaria berberidis CBS 394.84 TaxID=1168544 RepID=A0A9P4L773_9PLEO|nr:FAD-binding domain-containing protein [Cucurbitaria berberidis CBS 394.84]KAF1844012.1 FAD-binding domain-containing protein [Cucurbitaria berberidis CBS 394.84]